MKCDFGEFFFEFWNLSRLVYFLFKFQKRLKLETSESVSDTEAIV